MSGFGQDLQFALDAIWKVLAVSLVLGAGLPAIFALGVRSLAWGDGGDAETSHAAPNPVGKVLAVVLFAFVAYAIGSGILFVIASGQGKTIGFTHVVPQIVEKAH